MEECNNLEEAWNNREIYVCKVNGHTVYSIACKDECIEDCICKVVQSYKEKNKETAINPDYYKGNIETIDYIEQITKELTGVEAICVFNIIKYISRYSKKNGIEDVKKSQWYLDKLIKFLENKYE